MSGQLFTQYYLTEGIKSTDEWRASTAAAGPFAEFRESARRQRQKFAGFQDPNEAVTEQELIRPVLELLGWTDYLPQQSAARGEDIPDLLLFADGGAKAGAAARPSPDDRHRDALAITESKRLGQPLDARGGGKRRGGTPAAQPAPQAAPHARRGRRVVPAAPPAPQAALFDLDSVTPARARASTPHGQILRYLRTAESVSEGRIRWGILTNGGVWRLYDQRARPRATGYFEVDLTDALQPGAEDSLRAFYLLFHRDSFIRGAGATATFLETALAEGRRYEEQVAQDLSRVVFERAFPSLAQALANAGGQDLAQVREAALVLLYRLLFVLYAEDRGLLPVNDSRYDDYGLRKPVRDDITRRMAEHDVLSGSATKYYDHVMTLCKLIDEGDASIGLPPYNGGLFAAEAAPLLQAVRLPDAAIAPIIHDLSHAEIDGQRRFVNYRDMSVQQLGSIYERLLEREPVRGDGGEIDIRLNAYARKDSGSFYTPQPLVDLIVERTLEPLVNNERLDAFEARAAGLKSDRRPKKEREAELRKLDPAEAVLDLKVLDPAMGSGHFLVTAVDYLSDYVASLVEYAPAVPDWLGGDYESPLVGRIESIRGDIRRRAKASDWILDDAQLTDQAIIRRMVLKRCIYGVDKNPLTVELAKVSLWLHSFTDGAPLSFLDHHLRGGDSLIGLGVADAQAELRRLNAPMFVASALQGVENAAQGMRRIEQLADADLSEVHQSQSLFEAIEAATADLRGFLDTLGGLRWLTAGMKKRERAAFEAPLVEALGQALSNAYKLLAGGPDAWNAGMPGQHASAPEGFEKLWEAARSVAGRESFLHWEAAFPGVWRGWQDKRPEGGFDAVIGNPPWDRIKLQEVEWFATRDPAIARAPTAAARKGAIERLRGEARAEPAGVATTGSVGPRPAPGFRIKSGMTGGGGDAGGDVGLAAEYDAAKARADSLGQVVRASGHYPLLGGGDINLYSLFVERALRLVKPDGLVGLLTPSGIYADKTAARFFKSVSTSGRVGGLFDFENKKIFFKDVHASFKFCALIVGGEQRRFDETKCGFFLHDTKTIDDPDRCFPLAPADFARVNPNTGTAPIFRSRRDADITRRIYERHPVLVDRSGGDEVKAWPVRYVRMLDMTNDSGLFRTSAQLEDAGFYPAQGNRWKRGKELYLPLYQGRMIQHFDHRASSVRLNPENTHNPYLSEETSDVQHRNSNFLPRSQYWVPDSDVQSKFPKCDYALGFRDIARPTDVRTVIAAVVPQAGYGNTIPLLLERIPAPAESPAKSGSQAEFGALGTACLAANLSAMCLDFVARQKAQGTHLNWFILEQLPVIAPDAYDRRFGDRTAADLIKDHVLRLTYTAHDMAPFARDLGYDGDPFAWDEEDRRHLRARLDACYFHLYGLSRDDAGYILDTFPIVKRQDEAEFGGYRTRDLVLAYMNALAAGDAETVVAV